MLKYEDVKRNKNELLALTGLTLKEFKTILSGFRREYDKQRNGTTTLSGERRIRKSGSGPEDVLGTDEQKLFFILVYLKTYPLQIVMTKLFGMSQPRANQWIHRLLPIVKAALDALGVMPERTGEQFADSECKHGSVKDYAIDGTERRRQRPKVPEKQALHYSCKY